MERKKKEYIKSLDDRHNRTKAKKLKEEKKKAAAMTITILPGTIDANNTENHTKRQE